MKTAAVSRPIYAKQYDAVFVLGGGLIKEGGIWRTTYLDEPGDMFGSIGDRLRVEAAAYLYSEKPAICIVVLGGKGQYQDIPNAPYVSTVLKKELVELGIPADNILEERETSNTYDQLRATVHVWEGRQWKNILLVSNEHHRKRVLAMIDWRPELHRLKNAQFVAAEDILMTRNPEKWKAGIERAYKGDAMRERIALEERGVRQIENGTYRLTRSVWLT